MSISSRVRLLLVAAFAFVLAGCGLVGSDGEDYPTETVRLIVPYSAGGGVDTITRGFAEYLPRYLDDADVVVENWTGAGGRIAAARFQDVSPHHIYSDVLPSLSISEIGFPDESQHDTLSWHPIYGYSDESLAVFVHADSEYETFDQLVEDMAELDAANPGLGTPIHLQGQIMADALDVEFTDIPEDGTSGAFAALLGQNVDFVVGNIQNAFQYDEVRILATFGSERDDRIPDVPTAEELGYDVPAVPQSRGFFAPPEASQEIQDQLEEAFANVVADEDWIAFAEENGVLIVPMDADEFREAVERGHELAQNFEDIIRPE